MRENCSIDPKDGGVPGGDPAAGNGDSSDRDHEADESDQSVSHAAVSPGKMTRLTTARLSSPKNSSAADCHDPEAARQMASSTHAAAIPPLHQVTPIRKRGSELPGSRVGCQLICLPHAPSHREKTCAHPRAIPSGQTDGPYRA